jgi:hypothetical protein
VSTSAATLTDTKESQERSERPLWHHFCKCQAQALPGEKRARCGVCLAGRGRDRRTIQPVDICILCMDQEESNTPCKMCGEPPYPEKP